VRLDTLLKLSGALGVPVTDLTSGISWAPSEQWLGCFFVIPQEADDAADEK
jgi:hypothetical protein